MDELDLYKPALIALVLALLWTLETIVPEFVERRGRTSHNAHNLALGLLNAGLLSLGFAALLVAVGQWAAGAGFGLLHWIDAPTWIEWTAAILLFDLWMYLWHRANHKIPFLWRFHSVHHSDAEMDASSTGCCALPSARPRRKSPRAVKEMSHPSENSLISLYVDRLY